MKTRKLFIFTVVLTFVLASCGGNQPSTPQDIPTSEPAVTRAIVVGDISDDPAEVIDGTQPFADYLAGRLSDYGITEGQVRIASSTEEWRNCLRMGM